MARVRERILKILIDIDVLNIWVHELALEQIKVLGEKVSHYWSSPYQNNTI